MWQRRLPFQERAERLDRRFKAGIVLLTLVLVAASFAGTSSGRYAVGWAAFAVRGWVRRLVGLPESREAIDAAWRLKRERDIRNAHKGLVDLYITSPPALQKLFDLAGMTPRDALLRWGNYDRTLMLSSRVFEPDEHGRSYRLLPKTKAIWVRRITLLKGPFTLFLVPDVPEVRAVAGAIGAVVVEESAQTTNSWGCRGPEPDPQAEVRGIVLGDSFMQGMFIGDAETPPLRLEHHLREARKTTVSVLNTGHLGYSPEQYYYTLREYAPQFRPDFVVVAVFANDFGDIEDVLRRGQGNWDEARYWLDEIRQYCRTREILCLMTPIPAESQLAQTRRDGFYPGLVANLTEFSPIFFDNPLDDFIDENLRLKAKAATHGQGGSDSLLYNGHIGDTHFSSKGADLWARVIARRLVLLWEYRRQSRLAVERRR
jgi:lysophospholipase L1-like esterase